jgi:hypothetical protein
MLTIPAPTVQEPRDFGQRIAAEVRPEPELPRLAWTSHMGSYRMVITTGGPSSAMNQLTSLDDAHYVPGSYWVLEVRDGYDMLGKCRWRTVDRNGDPGIWRDAFRELAAEKGLFS